MGGSVGTVTDSIQPVIQPVNQPLNTADKGPGQPTHTAMGTPIVYGKTYYSPLSAVSNSSGGPVASNNTSYRTSNDSQPGNSDSSVGPGNDANTDPSSADAVNGMDAASDAASAGGGGSGGK